MGRKPCCEKEGLNRGAWTAQEDKILSDYILAYGEGKWNSIPRRAGLKRCGKSCRLRWLNYLRPDIKRGNITRDEEDLIVRLHRLLGNRWSLIAGRLPGRTDNEIKNYWNTNLSKKVETEKKIAQAKKTSSICNNEKPKSGPIKTMAFKCTTNFSLQDDNLPARTGARDRTQLMGSSDESSARYFNDVGTDDHTSFDLYELDPAEEGGVGDRGGWRDDEFFNGGYSFMSEQVVEPGGYGGLDQRGNEFADDFNFLNELLDSEGAWLEEIEEL